MRFACNTCPYVHNITRKVRNGVSRGQTPAHVEISSPAVQCLTQQVRGRVALASVRFTGVFSLQVNSRKYPKMKEVDDVLGGAAAWENVDSTPGKWHEKRTLIVIL